MTAISRYQHLILFIAFAVLLRLFSFFPSVLDHDESTYMVIGNELLKGKQLYRDVTDTKPAFIFWLYSGLQYLFGHSIFLKRLFAAVMVGFTAYFVKQVSGMLFKSEISALAAGVIYVFYTSLWVYFGLSPNTELYFNLFTITALFFFLRDRWWYYFLGGTLMGVGFMFKYVVLMDYLAFVVFIFFSPLLKAKQVRWSGIRLMPSVISLAGFVLPFAFTALYFYLNKRFDDFFYITFTLPRLYGEAPSVLRFLVLMGDFLLRFLPFTLFILFVLRKQHKLLKPELRLLMYGWILAVLFSMFMLGKGFSHYAIQLMLPFSILAALFFHEAIILNRPGAFLFRGRSSKLLFALVFVLIKVFAYVDNVIERDYPNEIASYLKEKNRSGGKVYVANYQPVIYYLLEQAPPAKYVHSSLLFSDIGKAFMLNADEEINKIIEQRPEFVLVQYENQKIMSAIEGCYVFDTVFVEDHVALYQLQP